MTKCGRYNFASSQNIGKHTHLKLHLTILVDEIINIRLTTYINCKMYDSYCFERNFWKKLKEALLSLIPEMIQNFLGG